MTDLPEREPGRNLPLPFHGGENLPARQRVPIHYLDEEESISLEHYLLILRRRKWMLAAIAATFVVLAALQVFTATPMYKATARLQIDPESSRVVPFQEVAASEMAGGWFMENYMWTQTENLQSRDIAVRVVERLDLANDLSFGQPTSPGALLQLKAVLYKIARLPLALSATERRPEGAGEEETALLASRLQAGVEAKPVRNTRLIEVSYTGPDPQLAARIVNTLSEEFIEENLEGKYDATTRASDFLRQQLEDLQVQVERSEQELLDYAKRNNIVNLSERETIARKRLADLSDELTVAETELITDRAQFEAAEEASLDGLPEALKSDAIGRLEQQLSAARSKLASFSGRYGPEWPAVKEIRLEIEDLERQLLAEKRQALDGTRQEFEFAQDRYDKLTEAVEKQRALVDTLNESSIQYNILQREVDSNEELYQGLLQRLKEAGVAAGLRSSNIRIADTAKPPRGRSTPRRSRTLLLALVLGLFVGTGTVFLVEALDNTVKSSEDVTQHLGLPALGVVPTLDGTGAARGRWPRADSGKKTRPHIVQGAAELHRARSLEAYRSLRTALLLSHSGNPPQVILVTSALPGEGKSTTAANVAVALAQTGSRTLLVDLDMREPKLAEAFGICAEQGMTTFLSGNSDVSSQIHEAGVPNLFVVPAGPRAPNPVELIGSERMFTGMLLMREYFTYVVIDSPPILELSDALVASPHADGVILVTRGGKTPRKMVQRAADSLRQVGAKLFGVLVNDVAIEKTSYGYKGYSSAYFDRYHQRDNDSSQRSA
jgi:succinoglycan biosynthesis transport protein ExoP